jgi:hypothetical protein
VFFAPKGLGVMFHVEHSGPTGEVLSAPFF